MKKALFSLVMVITLICCKSKMKTEISVTTNETVVPKPSALEIAQKRWSGTTQSELDSGKEIFSGRCTKCHEEKKIATRSEAEWKDAIESMSPKAGLTEEEKEKLTKYILSAREAKVRSN